MLNAVFSEWIRILVVLSFNIWNVYIMRGNVNNTGLQWLGQVFLYTLTAIKLVTGTNPAMAGDSRRGAMMQFETCPVRT